MKRPIAHAHPEDSLETGSSGRCGAVVVEFALSFPILLITFVFVCQILNVYTYDILGSYAAFAAARVYAVQRNVGWEKEDFRNNGEKMKSNQVMAAKKAEAVAVTIMSLYTLPRGDVDEWDDGGVLEGYKAYARMLAVLGEGPAAAAYHRMKGSFEVIEYSSGTAMRVLPGTAEEGEHSVRELDDPTTGPQSFAQPLKTGYEYPDGDELEMEKQGGWLQALFEFFGWKSEIHKPMGHAMKVAQVRFTYRYETVMTRLSGPYLGPNMGRQENTTINMYFSSASPIEPIPRIDIEYEPDEVTEEEDRSEEVKTAEGRVKNALNQLYDRIEAPGAGLHDYLKALPNRKTWLDDPPWMEAKALVEDKPELVYFTVNTGDVSRSYESDPEIQALKTRIATWDKQGILLDIDESLDNENAYREKVIVWIGEEIDYIIGKSTAVKGHVSTIQKNRGDIKKKEKQIENEKKKEEPSSDKIQGLQDDIRELKSKIKEELESIPPPINEVIERSGGNESIPVLSEGNYETITAGYLATWDTWEKTWRARQINEAALKSILKTKKDEVQGDMKQIRETLTAYFKLTKEIIDQKFDSLNTFGDSVNPKSPPKVDP